MTGYDAHGNFLPPQQLVDEIERLQTALEMVIKNSLDWKAVQRIAADALQSQ